MNATKQQEYQARVDAQRSQHPAMFKDATLRDWFAGMALQGQLTGAEIGLAIASDAITAAEVAGSCYEWADAMLAARKEAK